jgi:hypothetical protein
MGIFKRLFNKQKESDKRPENREDPDEIKEIVLKANQAQEFAIEISDQLMDKFPIYDLRVASTADKTICISGVVDTEKIKDEIQMVLSLNNEIPEFHNDLMVFQNNTKIGLKVNQQIFDLNTLSELEQIFKQHKDMLHIEYSIKYSINGHEEKRIIILMNQLKAMAVYFRYEGDSGFTTFNIKGDKNTFQEFILSNGQHDKYSENMLIDHRDAYDIIRYYLLTGEMYDGIQWKEA